MKIYQDLSHEKSVNNLQLKNIRLLISGHLPPPMGGIGMFCQSLLNSSLPNIVDLRFVLTSSQKRDLSRSGEANVINIVWAIQDLIRFAMAVIRHKPQISHIATAYGLSFLKHSICVCIARFYGSRVLIHPHCSLSAIYYERSKLWKWFFRRMISLTNGIVVLSKEWLQLRSSMPECTLYYFPNAIDMTDYSHIARERISSVETDLPFRVLYLGRLGKNKGTFDLIVAAKVIQECGLRIIFDLVGDELEKGELEQLYIQIDSANLNMQIKIHKAAFDHEKLAFLREANVFIYPSHNEGMPLAIIEAMACGLPIIATRIGGIPELVVDGKNGVLVEPGKPKKLAAALQKLYENKELRLKMQLKSYQIAQEEFDLERRLPQLIDLYEKTLICKIA